MENLKINTIVDMAQGRLTPEESLQILEGIDRDEATSADLELVVDIINLASESGGNVFRAGERTGLSWWRRLALWLSRIFENDRVLHPVGVVSVVLVVLAMILGANALWTGPYEELTGIDGTAFEWNARGPGEMDIAIAYQLFTKGEYDESVLHLDRFLRSHPNGELVEYMHYSAGVVYLLSARHTIFTLFPSYNRLKVTAGLQHLECAIARTSSPRLAEESRYLRAKGFLMLGQKEAAIAELDSVRTVDGIRAQEASQAIARIQAIGP